MRRRFQKAPDVDLEDYICIVIENITKGSLTPEQTERELSVFALTLLSAKVLPKSLYANSRQ